MNCKAHGSACDEDPDCTECETHKLRCLGAPKKCEIHLTGSAGEINSDSTGLGQPGLRPS